MKDLEELVIPAEPTKSFRVHTVPAKDNVVVRTVQHHQLPMTVAYAFTNYRSQGLTLAAVVFDLLICNTFCSDGDNSIWFLRDFELVFKTSHWTSDSLIVWNYWLKTVGYKH